MSQVTFEVSAAVVGACVGSFLNVVAHRVPQIMLMNDWAASRQRMLKERHPTFATVESLPRDVREGAFAKSVLEDLTATGWADDFAARTVATFAGRKSGAQASRGQSLSLGGRSHCPHCGAQIAWYDNVPVLGWLLLRGRGRCCGKSISPRYPLIEALTAGLFWAVAHIARHGAVYEGDQLQWSAAIACGIDALFIAFLVVSTCIDWDHRILPDSLNIPMVIVGCGIVPFVVTGYAGSLSADLTPGMDSLLASLCGWAAGYGLTWGIRSGARVVFGKEAMGFGDVKFMGAIGAFLGWQGALLSFFLGCVVGAFGGMAHRIVTGDAYVPFGPFLAIGALLAMFCQHDLFDFLFHTWPEWQRSSPSATWLMSGSALLCILALLVLIRRGRKHG